MLLNQPKQKTRKRLPLQLEEKDWDRFEAVKKRAKDAGMQIDVEGALSAYLLRQIERAERTLKDVKPVTPADSEQVS